VAVFKIPSYTGSDPSEVLHMNGEDFLLAESILSKKIGQANRHISLWYKRCMRDGLDVA
jgi:hypothetical protein